MIDGDIDFIGLQREIREMREFGSRAGRAARSAMEEGLVFLHSEVPPYSDIPKRPDQTYRRTGLLGRSITSMAGGIPGSLSRVRRLFGDDIVGVWGSAVKYAQYVIGRGTQAWFHRDRWYTLQGLIEDNQRELVERMARRLFRKLLGD